MQDGYYDINTEGGEESESEPSESEESVLGDETYASGNADVDADFVYVN
jgi:hypothetical protein